MQTTPPTRFVRSRTTPTGIIESEPEDRPMILKAEGNLLTADTEALVNTVNCVGVMGRGIALQFKKAFPENFRAYEKACRSGQVVPGRMFVFETGAFSNPRFIINFPTKRHWKGNARIEDIESGLAALAEEIRTRKIASIAVPPLGCGLGGLDWRVVRPMIVGALESIPDLRVLLYGPAGAPAADVMPVGTRRPHLTVARALFILLMEQYRRLAYRMSLLEIQKLAYFLQEAGEPLRLNYEKGHYGPYAPNLNKVLEALEGHYTRGYGDSQKPDVEIALLDGAAREAEEFLRDSPESNRRLERVSLLIEGFETPHGMELLSSTHWVATRAEGGESGASGEEGKPWARTPEEAVAAVHAWNPRKKKMFPPEHVRVAWERLEEDGWVGSTTKDIQTHS